jgi:hypothetical protein
MKVMIALHGADLGARLSSESLRQGLAAARATALQVNLDDSDVAPALRFGPAQPITALVSVWTDGDLDAAIAAVAAAAEEKEPHAYRVTERVRLDPMPVPDGTRSDVLAQVAVLRRPTSMTRADYVAYWMLHHTPIAIRTQNTSGYIQNLVEDALTPSSPEIAAIVEEHFPMAAMTDPHAFYGSDGDDEELHRRTTELLASVARFGAGEGLDLVPTSRYYWSLESRTA